MPAAASFSYFEAHLACILLATNMPSCPSWPSTTRSEEHTSELQSRSDLVCRLLLEKKKTTRPSTIQPRVYTYLLLPSQQRFPPSQPINKRLDTESFKSVTPTNTSQWPLMQLSRVRC